MDLPIRIAKAELVDEVLSFYPARSEEQRDESDHSHLGQLAEGV